MQKKLRKYRYTTIRQPKASKELYIERNRPGNDGQRDFFILLQDYSSLGN